MGGGCWRSPAARGQPVKAAWFFGASGSTCGIYAPCAAPYAGTLSITNVPSSLADVKALLDLRLSQERSETRVA